MGESRGPRDPSSVLSLRRPGTAVRPGIRPEWGWWSRRLPVSGGLSSGGFRPALGGGLWFRGAGPWRGCSLEGPDARGRPRSTVDKPCRPTEGTGRLVGGPPPAPCPHWPPGSVQALLCPAPGPSQAPPRLPQPSHPGMRGCALLSTLARGLVHGSHRQVRPWASWGTGDRLGWLTGPRPRAQGSELVLGASWPAVAQGSHSAQVKGRPWLSAGDSHRTPSRVPGGSQDPVALARPHPTCGLPDSTPHSPRWEQPHDPRQDPCVLREDPSAP